MAHEIDQFGNTASLSMRGMMLMRKGCHHDGRTESTLLSKSRLRNNETNKYDMSCTQTGVQVLIVAMKNKSGFWIGSLQLVNNNGFAKVETGWIGSSEFVSD